MDQIINKKPNFKENLKSLYIRHKVKIFSIAILSSLILIGGFIWKKYEIEKNFLISEKYVKANLLLLNGETKKALENYEEIIFSKNKFYSLLSLNTIIDKDLVTNKEKILEYFGQLEKNNFDENELDLITFKKALFLIKTSEKQKSDLLLKTIIEKNSSLKSLAQEILAE